MTYKNIIYAFVHYLHEGTSLIWFCISLKGEAFAVPPTFVTASLNSIYCGLHSTVTIITNPIEAVT